MRSISNSLLAAIVAALFTPPAAAQITGGTIAGPTPWQVQLRFTGTLRTVDENGRPITRPEWSRRHLCGGTLIAPRWVLTAGHCLFDKPADGPVRRRADAEIVVRAGLSNIEQPGAAMHERRVRSILHPDYRHSIQGAAQSPPTRDNIPAFRDFALLELDEEMPQDNPSLIAALPLLTAAQQASSGAARMTGWGQLNSADLLKSAILQQAELQLLGIAACNRRYQRSGGPRIVPRAGVICAEGSSGAGSAVDICKGDSGGPLTVMRGGRRLLAGVASWASCGARGKPSVHGDVRTVRAWIAETTQARADIVPTP